MGYTDVSIVSEKLTLISTGFRPVLMDSVVPNFFFASFAKLLLALVLTHMAIKDHRSWDPLIKTAFLQQVFKIIGK